MSFINNLQILKSNVGTGKQNQFYESSTHEFQVNVGICNLHTFHVLTVC